ncbi:hypothetical protein ACPYO6_03170 [Georgenia sp. Z1344]|uniref:hypothetical protein n=1 Tax=Georgenia sp. Z1344 TaxID=3416706 RepID=UPI003CFAE34C
METRSGGLSADGDPRGARGSEDPAHEELGDTVRRPAPGRSERPPGATTTPRYTASGELGYGGDDGTSYPGSSSPVPTGEHVVSGSWGASQVDDEPVETTTGTYAVQEPDGGYDGYAAVGAGAYRSGGVDPYGGQAADPRAPMWQQPPAGGAPNAPGEPTTDPYAGLTPSGSFGHSAHAGQSGYGRPGQAGHGPPGGPAGPGGYGAPIGPGGPSGYTGPGGPAGAGGPVGPGGPGHSGRAYAGYPPGGSGGSRGPLIAVVAVVAVVVLALAVFGISRIMDGDDTASPESDSPSVATGPSTPGPSTPGPTTPAPTTPPPPGTEGSAGGDGDVSGLAYVVDTAGNDLGASLDGAFPQDGLYTSTLRITERTPVVVAAYSPDMADLVVTIEGNGVSHELTDSTEPITFLDFSGYPSTSDPSGAFVLEPGDYEMVVTTEDGDPAAFELGVASGDGTSLGNGDEVDVSVEAGDAVLYAVTLEEGQELTATLVGDSTDPMLLVVEPDGDVRRNDDWDSSSGYTGEDLPNWLDSALTVSGGAGEYVLIVTTYAGLGGDMVAQVTIE